MLAFGEGSNGVDVQQVAMVAKDLRLTEPIRERVPSPAPAPAPVAIPSPAQSPAQGPIPIHPISMHTLERYGSDVKQPSLLKRWAGRLGLVSA